MNWWPSVDLCFVSCAFLCFPLGRRLSPDLGLGLGLGKLDDGIVFELLESVLVEFVEAIVRVIVHDLEAACLGSIDDSLEDLGELGGRRLSWSGQGRAWCVWESCWTRWKR